MQPAVLLLRTIEAVGARVCCSSDRFVRIESQDSSVGRPFEQGVQRGEEPRFLPDRKQVEGCPVVT